MLLCGRRGSPTRKCRETLLRTKTLIVLCEIPICKFEKSESVIKIKFLK
jgi:hypothetical protein